MRSVVKRMMVIEAELKVEDIDLALATAVRNAKAPEARIVSKEVSIQHGASPETNEVCVILGAKVKIEVEEKR